MKTRNEYTIHVLLDMGEALLQCGAEVHRVEDTLTRIAKKCGMEQIDIFVITSSMVLTVMLPGGCEITQTRRIHSVGTQYRKLDALNTLSRRFCYGHMQPEQLAEQLWEIMDEPDRNALVYAGSVLAVFCFCLFFGGSCADAIVSAAVAMLVCWMQIYVTPYCMTQLMFNFIAAFVTGLLICLIVQMGGHLHMDSIMIGDIMLLIPGVALTNGVRDMLLGDTIAGTMRLIEALLWTGALAVGFIAAIALTGGIFS